MNDRSSKRKMILAAGFTTLLMTGLVTAGYLSGKADASGIPSDEGPVYSGLLTDNSGKLISGTKAVKLVLWSAATGGDVKCTTTDNNNSVVDGHFSLQLTKVCAEVFSASPNLWLEITVDGDSLGRTKVSPVPYAIESGEKRCPPGYTWDTKTTGFTLCTRGDDQMVKVGDFWIDRFEMSIVDSTMFSSGSCNGSGKQYGAGQIDDYPTTPGTGFPDSADMRNGVKLHACSRSGDVPSRMMTWFQAAAACALSGKHLCTNGEWQVAAFGTPDDTSSCNVSTSNIEKAGARSTCSSAFGALDMVGNLWEWVDWWPLAGKSSLSANGTKVTPWPANKGYGDGQDGVWNNDGTAFHDKGWVNGLPAAALRGGVWTDGVNSGVFAATLHDGPSNWKDSYGARCCRR